jgi:hypothetical protein
MTSDRTAFLVTSVNRARESMFAPAPTANARHRYRPDCTMTPPDVSASGNVPNAGIHFRSTILAARLYCCRYAADVLPNPIGHMPRMCAALTAVQWSLLPPQAPTGRPTCRSNVPLGRSGCRSTPGPPAALGLRQQVRGQAAQAPPERHLPGAL